MSGIAGIIAEGTVDRRLLTVMGERLAHRTRAPFDPAADVHAVLDGPAGLLQLPAPTRPDDGPRCGAEGRLALVIEGHLGPANAARPDAERIFCAWQRHGPALVGRLAGCYALALWDRNAGQLLLARSRPGLRPLYVARTPVGIAFASEPKGLFPLLGGLAIDPLALACFLQARFVAGTRTLVAGIERIEPGGAVLVDIADGSVQRIEPAPLAPAPAATADAPDTLLEEALRACGPHAVVQDGAAAEALLEAGTRAGVPASAWVAGKPAEAAAAAETLEARFPGTAVGVVGLDAADLILRLPEAAWACDDLMWDPRFPARLAVVEAAASDEVLAFPAGAETVLGTLPAYHRPPLTRWLDRSRHPESGGLPGRGLFEGRERTVFGPGLHRAAAGWRTPWETAWASQAATGHRVARQQAVDLRLRIPDLELLGIDRAGAGGGAGTCVPWLDPPLIAAGLRRSGRVLRHRALPRAPGSRPAPIAGLPAVALDAWLTGETLERLGRVLGASPAIRNWFQPRLVTDLVARKRAGQAVTAELGVLLMLALWHRIWIEGSGERPGRADPLDLLEPIG